jgi:putative lipase involved disintegration of autophagic bodies
MTSLGGCVDVDGDIPGHLLSTAHHEVGGIPFDLPAVPWKSQHLFTLIKSNKFPASLSGTTGENNKSTLFPFEVSPFCRCHKTTHQCDQNCENHQLYMSDLTFASSSHLLLS